MTILKYTVHGMSAPSRCPEDHCCDCEGCWVQDKECPYAVVQKCMLCGDRSVFALCLDRPFNHTMVRNPDAGRALFWVCDNHVNDEKLLAVLKKGVPFDTAHSRAKCSSFVRREIEKTLV